MNKNNCEVHDGAKEHFQEVKVTGQGRSIVINAQMTSGVPKVRSVGSVLERAYAFQNVADIHPFRPLYLLGLQVIAFDLYSYKDVVTSF